MSGVNPHTSPLPPEGVSVRDNQDWANAQPRISVIVSTSEDDSGQLIRDLSRLAFSDRIEIIVHVEADATDALLARLAYVAARAHLPVRLSISQGDHGLSRALAVEQARADWLLVLDWDMAPGSPDFIARLLTALSAAPQPCAVFGGVSLPHPAPPGRRSLHKWLIRQAASLAANERAMADAPHFETRNILVHRDALRAAPIDDSIVDERWRDAEWVLRFMALGTVIHIDNPAHKVVLRSAGDLLRSQRASGASFAAVLAKHPKAVRQTPVYRSAQRLKSMPARELLRFASYGIARTPMLPSSLRGRAFNLWRDLLHARALACLDTPLPPTASHPRGSDAGSPLAG